MITLERALAGLLVSILAASIVGCSGESAPCARHRDDTPQTPDAGDGSCCTGTPESAVQCLPCADERFDVRIGTAEVLADGVSPVPILAIGSRLDGSPSVATVALVLSRDNAGILEDALLELGPLGATTDFIPCFAGDPGCLGPFSIALVYPSEPIHILASRPSTLVEPQ